MRSSAIVAAASAARAAMLGVAARPRRGRQLGREPVAPLAEVGGTRLPGRDRCPSSSAASPGRRVRWRRGSAGSGVAQSRDLGVESGCCWALVPGGLAGDGLGLAGGGAFRLLGSPAVRRPGVASSARAVSKADRAASRRATAAVIGLRAEVRELALGALEVRRQAGVLGPPLERSSPPHRG